MHLFFRRRRRSVIDNEVFMPGSPQWTVEQYKSFEFWLSHPHAVGASASRKKWECELRILRLKADANEQTIVVKTIYPYTSSVTPEGAFASAFVESLRICDQLLD
jgi:hypothetical protein